MNEEERLILKGYELALTGIGDRLTDITRTYNVLNEAHTSTQVQLEGLRKTTDFIRTEQTRLSDIQQVCAENLELLTTRFNSFESSAKTILSILKWIVTPAMVINFLYIIYRLAIGN